MRWHIKSCSARFFCFANFLPSGSSCVAGAGAEWVGVGATVYSRVIQPQSAKGGSLIEKNTHGERFWGQIHRLSAILILFLINIGMVIGHVSCALTPAGQIEVVLCSIDYRFKDNLNRELIDDIVTPNQ